VAEANLAAAIIAPVIIISAGSIAYSTAPASAPLMEGDADAMTAARSPKLVDFIRSIQHRSSRFSTRATIISATDLATKTRLSVERTHLFVPAGRRPDHARWHDDRPLN